jgi:hypothetical protein|uniref:SspH2 (Leucine-rich repeat protein) n=1 Tax=Podoviridae sp. ctz6O13 TaxID=2827757 RepID=A0A8S5TKG9_9CAUD|nr:MAG TPA: SspH2 (Leucine-rich repeat protein) [Podoviridae sp. ctz6O13]
MTYESVQEQLDHQIIRKDDMNVCEGNLILEGISHGDILPDNLVINGSLIIFHSDMCLSPKGWKVCGNVYLEHCDNADSLFNSDITIDGGLTLEYVDLTCLPQRMKKLKYLSVTISSLCLLPDDLELEEDFYLYGTQVNELPDGFKCGGSITISNQKLDCLPDNLTVNGSLTITQTSLRLLPKGLKVKYNLDAEESYLEELPDDIEVGRNIFLNYTHLRRLPDNLTVHGNLECNRTLLTELPEGLCVEGALRVSATQISLLPDSLYVRHSLYANDTLLPELPKRMGELTNITLVNCPISLLPEGMYCNCLDITGTKVKKLPKSMVVNSLYISKTGIEEIPEGCKILGTLYLSEDMDKEKFWPSVYEVYQNDKWYEKKPRGNRVSIVETDNGKILWCKQQFGKVIQESENLYVIKSKAYGNNVRLSKDNNGVWQVSNMR